MNYKDCPVWGILRQHFPQESRHCCQHIICRTSLWTGTSRSVNEEQGGCQLWVYDMLPRIALLWEVRCGQGQMCVCLFRCGCLGSFSVFLAESTILGTLGGTWFGHHSECIRSCFVLWGYFLKIVFYSPGQLPSPLQKHGYYEAVHLNSSCTASKWRSTLKVCRACNFDWNMIEERYWHLWSGARDARYWRFVPWSTWILNVSQDLFIIIWTSHLIYCNIKAQSSLAQF